MNHAKPARSSGRRRGHGSEQHRQRPQEPKGPQDAFRNMRRSTSNLAQEIGSATRTTTKELIDQVSKVSGAVSETVKDEAQRLLDEQRDTAAAKVTGMAKITRQAAHGLRAVRLDNVAEMADSAAKQAQFIADYVKESDVTQVLEDAEDLVRRHRALVTGGLFVAGLALARFLKASAEDEPNGTARRGQRQGRRDNDEDEVSSGDDE